MGSNKTTPRNGGKPPMQKARKFVTTLDSADMSELKLDNSP